MRKTLERRPGAPAALLCLVALVSGSVSLRGEPSAPDAQASIEAGRALYRVYCRGCHGEFGRGDGVAASGSKVPPADLTRLGRAEDERFPEEAVRRAIDGRGDSEVHGRGGMPIWGLAFQELDTDVDQEGQVRERVDRLVDYLRSIQEPS